MNVTSYKIRTPNYDITDYNNNRMCIYNFPPPQHKEHLYINLFNKPPSIKSTTNFECLDSLQFDHHGENSIITCGDEFDNYTGIHGHQVISNITITFRSNQRVKKRGADFFVVEYFAGVCCP